MKKLNPIKYIEDILSHNPTTILLWMTQGIIIDGNRYIIKEFRLKDDKLYAVISDNKYNPEYFEVQLFPDEETVDEETLKDIYEAIKDNKISIDKEVTDRKNEINRVNEAISANTAKINKEITDRQNEINHVNEAISANTTKINKEITDRQNEISRVDGTMSAIHDNVSADHAEIIQARGGHPSLDARLDGLDAKDTELQNQINTNKTSITTTDSRIDNLIANAGNGTVPSELIDIRVAYDGKSYNTAGKAVREQFTKLSKGVLTGNMVLPLVKSEAITNFINPVNFDKISNLVPGGSLKKLVIKDVLEGSTRVSVQVDKTQATGLDPRFTIAQYDASSGDRVGDIVYGVRTSGTFDLPDGYLYTIIFAINGDTDADLTQANVSTYFKVDIIHYSVDYASKSITNFINPLGWNNISNLVPGGSLNYLTIKDVLEGGTRVSVQVDKTQATGLDPRFSIVQYDASTGYNVGELVTGVRNSGTFDLPEGYLYTILFAIKDETDADLTQANVDTYFKVGIIIQPLDYAPKSITLDKISDEAIKALSAPQIKSIKTMHMSFDDTWKCLYDLITNNISYSSIFDNAFLNDLKDVHSATGMVFTLNCFNTYSGQPSYNISGLAELTKFRDEFKNNSSWLRFSFHAQDDTTRYDSDKTSQIVQSYNTFTNAIYKLTGTTDSIDTVVRLGFFTGTLNNCLAIRNAPCGITGILAADDTRSDYYFDSATRDYLASRGFDYDSTNRLKLCKTIKRLESITDISSELANYDGLIGANKNKRLEFFTHEYAWTPKIKSMLLQIGAWANSRGYSHLYLQDV